MAAKSTAQIQHSKPCPVLPCPAQQCWPNEAGRRRRGTGAVFAVCCQAALGSTGQPAFCGAPCRLKTRTSPPLGVLCPLQFCLDALLFGPALWSAEDPALYLLALELRGPGGEALEVEACQVGAGAWAVLCCAALCCAALCCAALSLRCATLRCELEDGAVY